MSGGRMRLDYKLTKHSPEMFSLPPMQKIIKRVLARVCDDDFAAGLRFDQKVRIIDPFARNYRQLGCVTISNDLHPDIKTDYTMEANDFGEFCLANEFECDVVFFDPPYTLRQLKDLYDGIGKDLEVWQCQNQWGRCKDALAKCVREGGYAISLGYHTHGFSERRGFRKEEVTILNGSGKQDRYDILVTVERKVQSELMGLDFEDE
jgi:hypothetical protein